MKLVKKIISVVLGMGLVLTLAGCSSDEYKCDCCGAAFSSGGSVSKYEDRDIAFCPDCMESIKDFFMYGND